MQQGYGSDKPIKISEMQPLEFKILIQVDTAEDKSAGGLFLPDSAVSKDQYSADRGTIVKMAGNAFKDSTMFAEKPGIGDRVVYSKYSGMQFVEQEGRERTYYRLMNDKDICAILK